MKRFTIKSQDGITRVHDGYGHIKVEEEGATLITYIGEAIDKLAHYEDLEEQERLVVLPCKVDMSAILRLKKAINRLSQMDISNLCLGDQCAIEVCVGEVPELLYVPKQTLEPAMVEMTEMQAKE